MQPSGSGLDFFQDLDVPDTSKLLRFLQETLLQMEQQSGESDDEARATLEKLQSALQKPSMPAAVPSDPEFLASQLKSLEIQLAAAEQQVIEADPATKAIINAGASIAPSVFPTVLPSTPSAHCIPEDKSDRLES